MVDIDQRKEYYREGDMNKARYYKNAYKLLIGKEVPSVVLLDKDYYPIDHLNAVGDSLKKHKTPDS